MKRFIIAISIIVGIAALAGCSNIASPVGYGTATPSLIYTHITFPGELQDTHFDNDDCKILGEVHGTSSTSNILGIASFGDGGIEAAYKNALQKIGGDAIVNARVDTEASSILNLFSTVTTHVYGTAIKYNK